MANDLDIPAISDGQADDQWQTSNDGDAALGNALADIYTVDFSGGDVTLTAAQFRSAMTFVPSGLSATRALTLPAVKRALFFVHNTDASDAITVTRGATTVSVAAGKIGALYTDGTTNGLVGIILTPGVGASGDVVGPASVTDGNPSVFDGTTGKLIKERTFTQFTASLSAVVGDSGSGGTKGLVPAPGAGDAAAGKFLKADGTFAVPAGSGIGDVVGPGSTVNNNVAVFDGTTGKLIKDGGKGLLESIIIAVGDETTAITTGTAKVTFRMPYAFTLSDVRASLTTVSSSGIPTVDINESGTTILSTKLTIDASEKTSTTAATAAVISDANLADDAEMTIDIDVAGTGAAGLKVYLIGVRA